MTKDEFSKCPEMESSTEMLEMMADLMVAEEETEWLMGRVSFSDSFGYKLLATSPIQFLQLTYKEIIVDHLPNVIVTLITYFTCVKNTFRRILKTRNQYSDVQTNKNSLILGEAYIRQYQDFWSVTEFNHAVRGQLCRIPFSFIRQINLRFA